MESYPRAAVERAMKIQEVLLRAVAKKITWGQAAEIIGISGRHMRRWKAQYEEFGYDGLFDRRLGKPSPKRVPLPTVEEIPRLYQEQYADCNVRTFTRSCREASSSGRRAGTGPRACECLFGSRRWQRGNARAFSTWPTSPTRRF
jgi:hypothetical protein